MDLNYCIECGKPLTFKSIGDEGEQKHCSTCNRFYFDNPVSCVLVAIMNEKDQVLLLKQNYISTKNYTLCSGYLKKGDTLEETVAREVLEETGQSVLSCEYVKSYYFAPKNLIMTGFIAYVRERELGKSKEVDSLMWVDIDKAADMIERENNYSWEHFVNCLKVLKSKGNQYHENRCPW